MDRIKASMAIIGGGAMARAIYEGGVIGGVLDSPRVIIAEPVPERGAHFLERGAKVYSDTAEALRELASRDGQSDPDGFILLAVKPQVLPQVAPAIRAALDVQSKSRLVTSILAGTTTARLGELLGPNARIVRVMPNLPAQIRRGTTAICKGPGASPGDAETVEHLFRAVGQLVVPMEESLMDAFTAVAGSGPAYVFFLARAMTDAAVSLGFDPATARRIVQETIAGSGDMLAQSGGPPEQLLASVQSKGGTTEAAMDVLAQLRVHEAFIAALTAARDRGRALSR